MKLLLFDVDGTLAKSAMQTEPYIIDILKELKNYYDIALISGGAYNKLMSQVGLENKNIFKYVFSENGLVSYKNDVQFHIRRLKEVYTEDQLQNIINYLLAYLITLKLPYKRGTFLVMRTSMWYFSPIGKDCSLDERYQFAKLDEKEKIREKIIKDIGPCLRNKYKLDVSIGGQIGLAIHPIGWNKSYALQFIKDYDEIYFFGDRCSPIGNDYPLYSHPKIHGHHVKDPEHTYTILKSNFVS